MPADIQSGNLKFLNSKMKIFLYWDTTVVSERWKGKYIENGKTYDAVERCTSTYARQNGQWRCTSIVRFNDSASQLEIKGIARGGRRAIECTEIPEKEISTRGLPTSGVH